MTQPRTFLDRFDFKDAYLASRPIKANKILRVLEREMGELSAATLLDIGCSQGGITEIIGRSFALAVGLDPDPIGNAEICSTRFVQADGCRLPFAAASFDAVLLNHVLEHAATPALLLEEIRRVMKSRAVCYLACPNRWTIVEPHYRLPFLSWLPRSWAHCYVRWMRRGPRYLDVLPSYWQLRDLTRGFKVSHLTLAFLKRPDLFFPDDRDMRDKVKWVSWMPESLLGWLVPLAPVFVLILRK